MLRSCGSQMGRDYPEHMFLLCPAWHAQNNIPEIELIFDGTAARTLLLGGDMNAVMDADFDRTGLGLTDRGERGLLGFIDALGLSDIWRAYNTQQRQYTFYSARHGPALELIISSPGETNWQATSIQI